MKCWNLFLKGSEDCESLLVVPPVKNARKKGTLRKMPSCLLKWHNSPLCKCTLCNIILFCAQREMTWHLDDFAKSFCVYMSLRNGRWRIMWRKNYGAAFCTLLAQLWSVKVRNGQSSFTTRAVFNLFHGWWKVNFVANHPSETFMNSCSTCIMRSAARPNLLFRTIMARQGH